VLTLAWILAIGLVGPLLALPKRFRVPIAVGEILIGVVFGQSGLRKVPLNNSALSLIADIGFALVMMVAGSHIDMTRFAKKAVLGTAVKRQILVFAVGIPLAYLTAQVTNIHQAAIFFVLITSSSAALIMPIFATRTVKANSKQIAGTPTVTAPSNQIAVMLTQVAIADLLCVIALPLVMDGKHLPKILAGAAIITVAAVIFGVLLHYGIQRGYIDQVRNVSKTNHFGLELRVSLILLLALAGIAKQFTISVMVAGFAIGLALAANGMPHRLARQLFAVTEGLFAPFFFVWLGAKVDIRAAFNDRHLVLLAVLLGAAAILTHAANALAHQPLPLAITASAQLGVPVAAVTIGQTTGVFNAGQGGAIMLAALITIFATMISNSRPSRSVV
jgi:Kef-type K+ transport system membrane component KefB